MAMRDNVRAGDDMIVTGGVLKTYVAHGEHRVDLEVTIAATMKKTLYWFYLVKRRR